MSSNPDTYAHQDTQADSNAEPEEDAQANTGGRDLGTGGRLCGRGAGGQRDWQ